MRTIELTSQFKRDFKRENKGKYHIAVEEVLFVVIEILANDQPMNIRYQDYAL